MEPEKVSSLSSGTLAYYFFFLRWRVRFREGWLKKKNFASWNDADELKKKPITGTTKLIGDFAIFYNIRWSHKAYFSKNFCMGGAFEGKIGRCGEGGNRKRNNLHLFDKGFRIKVLHRQFRFVFHRRLLSKEPENLISWHDRSAESVFSNLFPERGTSVFFALRHAMYLQREMRNENKQRLRSERVAFWLTWVISYEDF